MSIATGVNNGLKVLIIDDDDFITARLKAVIEKLPCQVHAISDGKDLGGALVSYQPDVIFLDLILPGMDGVEIIDVLAKAGCRSKIVLMSGLDQRTLNSVKELALTSKLDVIDTLHKPIQPDAIGKILTPLLNRGATETKKTVLVAEFGPDALFEQEMSLDEAVPMPLQYRTTLAWRLDNGELRDLDSLIEKSERRHTTRGELALLFNHLSALATALGANGQKVGFKVPLPNALLADASILAHMDHLFSSRNIGRDMVSFELSDTALERTLKSDTSLLSRMKIKGLKVAFCVSQSGDETVALLNRLPVDEIMLDMSNSRYRDASLSDQELEFEVASLVSFAKRLGLISTACQVSSAAQLAFAKRCKFARASGRALRLPDSASRIFQL